MAVEIVRVALGTAWTKILDKEGSDRKGELVVTGDADFAWVEVPGTDYGTLMTDTPQEITIPMHKELWGRGAGGVGTPTISGTLELV